MSRAAGLQWSSELGGTAAKCSLIGGKVLTTELVRAAQMLEQISGLISKATELHEELERERAAASAHLDRLAAISAGVDCAKQQPLPQLPEVCPMPGLSRISRAHAAHLS